MYMLLENWQLKKNINRPGRLILTNLFRWIINIPFSDTLILRHVSPLELPKPAPYFIQWHVHIRTSLIVMQQINASLLFFKWGKLNSERESYKINKEYKLIINNIVLCNYYNTKWTQNLYSKIKQYIPRNSITYIGLWPLTIAW